jgi:hypothetical protein
MIVLSRIKVHERTNCVHFAHIGKVFFSDRAAVRPNTPQCVATSFKVTDTLNR